MYFFPASVYNHAEKYRHIDESVTQFFLTTSVQLIFLINVFQKLIKSPQNQWFHNIYNHLSKWPAFQRLFQTTIYDLWYLDVFKINSLEM